MYAIIADSGKQFCVEEGTVFDVDLRDGEPASPISFDSVLAIGSDGQLTVGKPTINGAKVVGEIVDHVRGPKIVMAMYKRRKNFRKTKGHRQSYTRVKVTQILGS